MNEFDIPSTLTPNTLEGSILGDMLDGLGDEFYVAPKIGVDFVEPWKFVRDGENWTREV